MIDRTVAVNPESVLSLFEATALDGSPLPRPPGRPPWPCIALDRWAGRAFRMPPGDPRLEAISRGEPAPPGPLWNLEGAVRDWAQHPDWMDLQDPSSPVHGVTMLERDLYLHHWETALRGASRVLDLGVGAGRFAGWLLERGCEVEGVDPILPSLWRTLWHAAGGPGRLDLHWTTGERLPDLAPVDAVVCAEVACYVEDPEALVEAATRVLKPGGVLCLSVEATLGWAAAPGVAPGTLGALLDGGPVSAWGDRWVRTYDEAAVRALLHDFEILELAPTHYAVGGPFEAAAGAGDFPTLLDWEARCRAHPITRPWNRAWTVLARKRGV
ncbi:MAG: class I SAM-dependent methyltransferase [Deltaproteobacteria bacterium]|nr:class I SAM-dependent methyltransferase [Deltaproteobacteria bacterium]